MFGLVIAAILEDKVFRKSERFFQTIFFIPTLLSLTVVCLLFEFIYNPQMGLLNSFFEAVGLDGLTRIWLGTRDTAMFSIIAVSQWQSFGYITMLFIVAIQKIPSDLYEAAIVDGAGKIRRFFTITPSHVQW